MYLTSDVEFKMFVKFMKLFISTIGRTEGSIQLGRVFTRSSIPGICSCLIIISLHSYTRRVLQVCLKQIQVFSSCINITTTNDVPRCPGPLSKEKSSELSSFNEVILVHIISLIWLLCMHDYQHCTKFSSSFISFKQTLDL
jgi:hypothetical protein